MPAAPRFGGEVVILTSATNSSAAFEFVQRARQAGVARLIGTPTGGKQRGINGGARPRRRYKRKCPGGTPGLR